MNFVFIGKAAAGVGLMIVLDILSGFTAAASNGELSSKRLREGLMHKLAVVLAVALAVALEWEQTILPIGLNVPIVSAVATYIIIMETCSIYENVKKINPEFEWQGLDNLFKFSNDDEKDNQNE